MAKLEFQVQQKFIEAGCDEAGRGCLAGPVVAAAVILPKGFSNPLLDDSKKLSLKQRLELQIFIKEKARAWGVGICSPEEIDEINILNASFLAMHKAIDQLGIEPGFLAIDGNRFNPYKNIAYSCQVKGDGRFMNIAAASILAKTHRDEIMEKLAIEYPHYAWERNMGYPTKAHRQGIIEKGLSPRHRKSFKQLPEQLKLKL